MTEVDSAQPAVGAAEQAVFPEFTELEINALQYAATEAAIGCMKILATGQRDRAGMGAIAKQEGVLTKYDLLSEDSARTNLKRFGANIPILGEEKGLGDGSQIEPDKPVGYEEEVAEVLAGLENRIIWIVDPLDGSRPFANGAGTSTTIISAWDKLTKRFIATTIGHPQSGMLVEASNGRTYRSEYNYATDMQSERIPCEVWKPEGGMRADSSGLTLLIDNLQAFQKADGRQQHGGKRDVFTLPDLLRLQHEVSPHMAIQNMGSNGWHFSMLGMDNMRVGGALMNSIGNPGDGPGVHVVENAGGVVEAFWVNGERELEKVDNPHHIIGNPEHPTKVAKYDIVVAGATVEIASFVSDAVTRTFNRQLGVTI